MKQIARHDATMIRLEPETRERLGRHREIRKDTRREETYNDIIVKVLDFYEKHKKNPT